MLKKKVCNDRLFFSLRDITDSGIIQTGMEIDTNVAFGAASITLGVRKNTVNVSGFFV